jgi:hypothetical protein
MHRYFLFFFISIFSINAQVEQLQIGNLALPSSQQPGPVFCFGQNIVDKGDIQVLGDLNVGELRNRDFFVFVPAMLWGFSDTFSLYWGVPTVFEKFRHQSTDTILDGAFVQGEIVCYTKETSYYTNQITAVANAVVSSGNIDPRLPLNIDSTSIFLGATASHLATEWYCFTSPGIVWSINNTNQNRFGVNVLYQAGFGHNLGYSSGRWLLTGMIEFFGKFIYQNQDTNENLVNRANVIFMGPSLWFATQHLAIDIGVALPVVRIAPNVTRKESWVAAFDFRWKF